MSSSWNRCLCSSRNCSRSRWRLILLIVGRTNVPRALSERSRCGFIRREFRSEKQPPCWSVSAFRGHIKRSGTGCINSPTAHLTRHRHSRRGSRSTRPLSRSVPSGTGSMRRLISIRSSYLGDASRSGGGRPPPLSSLSTSKSVTTSQTRIFWSMASAISPRWLAPICAAISSTSTATRSRSGSRH